MPNPSTIIEQANRNWLSWGRS